MSARVTVGSVAVSPDGTKAYVSVAFPTGHLCRFDSATDTFVGGRHHGDGDEGLA
jgi:hypothetical protein